MSASEAKIRANRKYNEKTYRNFRFNVRYDTESDIIELLESKESVNAYILDLIKQDMKKTTIK